MRALVFSSAAVLAVALGAQVTTADGQQKPVSAGLPAGPSKALVERSCNTKCHNTSMIERARHTPAQWTGTVDRMVKLGAVVTPPERAQLVTYLSRHFPLTVNVNTASAAQIASGLEIPLKEATAIVQHRDKAGPFTSWRQLLKVPGVTAKGIENAKDRVVVKPDAAARPAPSQPAGQ